VCSGLSQYPLANPSPPRYNSPSSPTPTRLISSSNTYTWLFPIGLPNGTLSPSSTLSTSPQAENVVFSVGPYPLISRHPSLSLRNFLTCFPDNTSPPASNCLTFLILLGHSPPSTSW